MSIVTKFGCGLGLVLVVITGFIWYQSNLTEREISAFRDQVAKIAETAPVRLYLPEAAAVLPAPVQR